MQTEAEITKAIRHILKTCGIWHWKVHQSLGSTPGIPDIVGIYRGKFIAIEVKAAKGKVSDNQVRKISEINAAGGHAFVARSVDDVINALDLHDRFLC